MDPNCLDNTIDPEKIRPFEDEGYEGYAVVEGALSAEVAALTTAADYIDMAIRPRLATCAPSSCWGSATNANGFFSGRGCASEGWLKEQGRRVRRTAGRWRHSRSHSSP